MDRKITPKVWEKIRQEYISSNVSQRALIKKYGVPQVALAKRCKEEGWVEQREQFALKLKQKSTDELVEEHFELYELALDVSMMILLQIKRQMEMISSGMDGIAGSEMKAYTGAMKDLREMGFFRAELDKAEQKARIRKLEKESEEETKDTSIVVSFAPEIEEILKGE